MTIVAAAASLLLAPMLGVALWNRVTAPRLERHPPLHSGPQVSVLVPARDEADNLRRLIPALLATRYAPLEILVLDDGSDDGSGAVARSLIGDDPRARVVRGREPPPGWAGKNWACHQLAWAASGEVLVFCDADVRPGPEAVGRTVAALRASSADALTAFPRHVRRGLVERAVAPLVSQLPIAALLPLSLVPRVAWPSVSAGNGQWFAWTRDGYGRAGGHRAVRSDVLEDVRLARRAKAAGLRLLPVLAGSDLAVWMYRGPGEVWDGFAKNVYPLLGGRPRWLAAGMACFLLAMVAPLAVVVAAALALVSGAAAPSAPVVAGPVLALMALRGLGGSLFADDPRDTLLHPVGAILVPALAVRSWTWHRAGMVSWKRRALAVRGTR